ncbi:hypothetical protein MPTK1_3g21510 [Marchantia polymorpha subsp. ruderalis]|uniref:Uncharacterized protein n=2 Tax=Marchantia polymorpha TaxID=3197 RepID=A0AAF6B393_MARPO|nr:hypothetical protein MARPO_0089s0065 [Marchantia polymorpha]BBN06477.1 hypothetical protein Mp_3g21510 [Marchantia polymorpha subsp. ruderalis]|eukprot:PTQ33442.1 hypothetical protein MARPO_0089s0065 [Marchantia polymorpha]
MGGPEVWILVRDSVWRRPITFELNIRRVGRTRQSCVELFPCTEMRLVLHAPRRTSGPAPDTGLCRIGPIGKSARRHLVIGKPARRHHGDAEPRYGKTVAPGVQNYDYGTGREGKGRDGSTFVCHYRDEDYGPELRCVYNIRLGSSLRM